MIDLNTIKLGMTAVINDGTKGVIKGSYMSADGLVLRVLQGGGIVQRNVPLKWVTKVIDTGRIDLTTEAHGVGTVTEEEK